MNKLQKILLGLGSLLLIFFGVVSMSHPSTSLGAPFHNITVNPSGGIGGALTQNHILVGNAANLAADVPMGGDATIVSSGAVTLAGVLPAGGPIGSSTTTPIVTWDSKGRLTAVSSATITPAASSITGGQAVTRSNDTNVTMTLTASSANAVLNAYTMALGWTGMLSTTRGGTATPYSRPVFSTLFDAPSSTSPRSSSTLVGVTSTITYGNFGADINTGGGSASAKLTYSANVGYNVFARNPTWMATVSPKTLNKNGDFYIGMGDVAIPPGAAHTFTNNHVGFKIVVDGVPVARLFATQADGTTETVSSALTTVSNNDSLELYIVGDPSGGYDYYYSQNSGALSAVTALGITHLPITTSTQWLQVSSSNDGGTNVQELLPNAASYGR